MIGKNYLQKYWYYIVGILVVVLVLIIGSYTYYYNVFYQSVDLPLTTVVVAPKWVHQAQFAGMYVAIEKGFYQKQGLNVVFNDYSLDKSPFQKVQDKTADFGLMNASGVLLEASQGADILALAVFYQYSPYAIISLEGRGIHTPWEMKGKRIGIKGGTGSENELIVNLLLDSAGLKNDDISLVFLDLTSDERDDLISERADAVGFYRTRLYQFQKDGLAYDLIQPEQYGIVSYNDVLVSRPDFVREHPRLTKQFIEATAEGWKYAFEHQEETLDIIMKYVTKEEYLDREYQKSILEQSQPLIWPSKSFSIGSMDISKWEKLGQIIFKEDVQIDIPNIVTTDYLP